MDDFRRAEDQIALRSTANLDSAIKTLERFAQRYPADANVHGSLAEAYLLAREFGSLPDSFALNAAREAAKRTLKLDAKSARALRVLGVVAYWADHNPVAAASAFRQAIALRPADALAHQWFANTLVDNGEVALGLREFQRARDLNPGAPYLLADYGWGLWIAGRDREAETLLSELATAHPEMASIPDCLSVIAFTRGDLAGYARHLRQRANARKSPELTAYARSIESILGSGASRQVLYEAMLSRAMSQGDGSARTDHSWAAMVASVFADRHGLLSILRQARSQRERWGAAGFTRRIAARWQDDVAVTSALSALRQSKMEPGN